MQMHSIWSVLLLRRDLECRLVVGGGNSDGDRAKGAAKVKCDDDKDTYLLSMSCVC
jgi:hypothetical protein